MEDIYDYSTKFGPTKIAFNYFEKKRRSIGNIKKNPSIKDLAIMNNIIYLACIPFKKLI